MATADLKEEGKNFIPLFKAVLKHIPCPQGDPDGGLQLLAASLGYDPYIGRLVVGKINRGTIVNGQQVAIVNPDGHIAKGKVSRLMSFEGLERKEITKATVGEIVALAGLDNVSIGETITSLENPEPLQGVAIDEPTLSMNFMVNNSPFAGQEGEYVTSRKLKERLLKELNTNVSLVVEETDSPDVFKVSAR